SPRALRHRRIQCTDCNPSRCPCPSRRLDGRHQPRRSPGRLGYRRLVVFTALCHLGERALGPRRSRRTGTSRSADLHLDKERLRQAAELDGLRAAVDLICFCPETSRGEPVTLHPVISRLAEDIAAADGEHFPDASVDTVLTDPTVARSVADLITDETWQLDDVAIPTSIVSLEQFTAPSRVSSVLEGDFRHLLPETLSFSQIDQLLSDPLGWTLERGLGLR